MSIEVIMPALGMAQDSGLLIAWYKQEGDAVRKGEPLMEVETDKATVEIEAEADGVLVGISAAAGESVPVGTVIAHIVAASEAAGYAAGKPAEPNGAQAPRPEAEAPPPQGPAATAATPVAQRIAREHHVDLDAITDHGPRITKSDVLAYLQSRDAQAVTAPRPPASPLARRLAREAGFTIADLDGSGPGGAVLAQDVRAVVAQAAMQPPPVVPPASAPEPVPAATSRRWQVMAERLQTSWQTVPHFYLERDVDAGQLLTWQAGVRVRTETRITLTDLLVVAVAAALRRHARLNASWVDGRVVYNDRINVGLAVAVEDGLLVPVIHQADTLGLLAVAARRQELVERVLADRPKPADLQGGTFTISNLGMYHVDGFNAIVNPPEAAILAVGRVYEQVVPRDGQAAIVPVMTLKLSCDHRVVDGARGAQFLDTLAGFLQNPLTLLE